MFTLCSAAATCLVACTSQLWLYEVCDALAHATAVCQVRFGQWVAGLINPVATLEPMYTTAALSSCVALAELSDVSSRACIATASTAADVVDAATKERLR